MLAAAPRSAQCLLATGESIGSQSPVLWHFSGIAWSKRCGLGPRMDSVRLTDTRLFIFMIHRVAVGGSDCRLISPPLVRFQPVELWPSCIGFRNFAVNEVHVGSIPIGHPLHAAFDYWLGRLFFRQQEGDRNSHAVLASNEATLWRGRF